MGPNLLIAGVPRAGTTALAHSLAGHGDIHVTDPKEPHYLAFGDRKPNFTGPGDDVTINRQITQDRQAYLALFNTARPNSYTCDASVSTLYHWDSIGDRRELIASDARYVICLREPALRAYSAYLYMCSRGFETESFTRALELETQRIADGWHHMWHYTGCSEYASQISRLLQDVDRSRLCIVIAEELRTDHAAETFRILSWLGLSGDPLGQKTHTDINRGGIARNRFVGAGLSGLANKPRLRAAVRAAVPFALRHRLKASLLEHPPADSETLESLRALHSGDTAAVIDLIGRRPMGW